ncbi:MAG: DRTGG domain-containing protein [Clostridia bacterium]|nr:DRTGG domain-containing protein [Clostridia bacterium]
MSLSKHEQILRYIERLEVGTKVSVRQVAKELEVSDGTAYRAIKEAEGRGLVSSIPKVGTVRIEKAQQREIKELTLGAVARIVEGKVVCGGQGLNRTFKTFVIGASSVDTMPHYVEPHCLYIVGNREDAQLEALRLGADLLVVASFPISAEVMERAREKRLTIISTPYDTFAVTNLINRALNERLTEREVILVEDVMVKDVKHLTADALVGDWYRMASQFKHSRYPVVDENMRVLGLVTAVEVFAVDQNEPVKKVMIPAMSIRPDASVGHAARLMIWEGLEMLMVVWNNRLIGVLTRQDVINAFQHVQKQPQFEETVDNIILSGFRLEDTESGVKLTGQVNELMSNEFGAASVGSLVTLLNSAAYIASRKKKRVDLNTETLSLNFYRSVELDTDIEVEAAIVSVDKKSIRLEVTVHHRGEKVAAALVTGRQMER